MGPGEAWGTTSGDSADLLIVKSPQELLRSEKSAHPSFGMTTTKDIRDFFV